MEIKQISANLPWQKSIGRRRLDEIKHVIVHHNGAIAGDVYDAQKLYAQDASYHISKGWGHLGYSFRIARDGSVYQTVSYEEIGAHAGNGHYLKSSLGICLDGDFSRQKPSKMQIDSLRSLMKYLDESTEVPNITRKGFFGHREVRGIGIPGTKAFISRFTFCPGEDITNIVRAFRESVAVAKVAPTDKLIKGSAPEVYAYNGKRKFHIPDMETLTFFFPGVPIQVADQELVAAIPEGEELPSMK